MITPGEVRAVRELKNGVQAQVCIGASPTHGSAIVTVETRSAKVREAMAALKAAISEEAQTILDRVLVDQKKWDAEAANTASAPEIPAAVVVKDSKEHTA